MYNLKVFPYSKTLILGLAKSGMAAATLLMDSGYDIVVNDKNSHAEDRDVQYLKERGVKVVVGSHPLDLLDDVDLVIKNPGIPYENPLLLAAEKKNIPIITEIELASYLTKDMIGITGSNGKTTASSLVYEILSASEQDVELAGNIGMVASEVAHQLTEEKQLILELSSFQLMGIETFKPHIACILNIFAAHLDYHHTLEAYKAAKAKIFKNQTEDDYLVYNIDNPHVLEMVESAKSQLIPFSVTEVVESGAYLQDETIYFKNEAIIPVKDILLVGKHNLENCLAAIAISKLNGANNTAIVEVLSTFTGVEHRLQFVKSFQDRLIYNDSKATNIIATSKALSAFDKPIILIAGGLDRGEDFALLAPYLGNVKTILAYGETKDKIGEMAKREEIEFQMLDSLEEATKKAFACSEPGDVILLSPACASWDQFKTFEIRGQLFVDTILSITANTE